jgi:uncharacterized protein YndB with AHSA1/START domain
MSELSIERSIWLDIARQRVWDAITNPDELAKWLLPPMLQAEMKRDSQGTTFVCMMGMEIPVALFDSFETPQRATLRTLPDQQLTVTFNLVEANGGTHLTVTVGNLESLLGNVRLERAASIGAGWEKALVNLKAYLKGEDLPFPEGYVTALFGYRREAQETFSVERSIWIKTPRERVWQAVTDPQQIQQWYSPNTAWVITALEVGGRLFAPDPTTGEQLYAQVIDEVEYLTRFVTRALPDLHEATIYTLAEEGNGTRLTITNTGYEWKAEDQRHPSIEQNGFGFGMVLENLRAMLEGRTLPYPFGF